MMKKIDFSAQAAQLMSKGRISFCGSPVSLQFAGLDGFPISVGRGTPEVTRGERRTLVRSANCEGPERAIPWRSEYEEEYHGTNHH